MNRILSHLHKYNAQGILIILLISLYIGIEELTEFGVTGVEILLLVGLFNLITILVVSGFKKSKLLPKNNKNQFANFFFAGFGLLFLLISYEYISAASVAILRQLDIALITLAGIIFSAKYSRQKLGFIIAAFLIVIVLILEHNINKESLMGYVLILGATLLLSLRSLFLKKMATDETLESIFIIASAASFVYGLIFCLASGIYLSHISPSIFFLVVLLSIVNFFIFRITNNLYKLHTPEMVRFPFLIAGISTMFVEMLVENKLFSYYLITGNLALFFLLFKLVRISKKEDINDPKKVN
ncbi:hypothetical protein G3567_02530 [Psychroflexus sp. YR1-1]|uniref:EamA-like transporter family protein n=1 Tax=Psychroflexus aurantiacus TaxID=2709310 RepID=A0A6B3QYY8_9FLAO|nr:hypothetical protein [Psychroflexus aurantiacus]NEV93022.1 hypothetical protein [Psychroflexus aurantiacus]